MVQAKKQAYYSINSTMVMPYWSIGKLIVNDEQNGNFRAEYGKSVLENLSKKLSEEFGSGFSVRSLQQMKKFYLLFPNTNALRSQLTWTHYRSLLRVDNEDARNWYIEEAVKEHWSSRQLDRQISTMYYERLLSSQDKNAVITEANEKLSNIT